MTLVFGPDFHAFLCAAIDRRLRFLLIGGHAVAAHGHPRFTKDLDVLVDATLANGRRLHAALVDFGFGAVAPAPGELASPGPFWILGRAPNRIGILTQISGITFKRAWPNRIAMPLDASRTLWIMGREDLIANKRAAARPQDMADAAKLAVTRPRKPR